jgi:transcriptional regulator with XRE-family HTH domain
MGSPLGEQLRTVRQVRGISLKAVAEPAGISTAYLQKLESGLVRQPSPNVLHRLAGVLDIPYATLMELAGYVIPNQDAVLADNAFNHALSSSDLTEEEQRAVAAFIAHLRGQRR